MQIQHELPDGENPVRKIPLIVTGQDDQIQIDGIFAQGRRSEVAE
jgi:hypothetical protein